MWRMRAISRRLSGRVVHGGRIPPEVLDSIPITKYRTLKHIELLSGLKNAMIGVKRELGCGTIWGRCALAHFSQLLEMMSFKLHAIHSQSIHIHVNDSDSHSSRYSSQSIE